MFASILTALLLLPHWAATEPIQYCRFGHQKSPDATVDFCMGINMHHNVSSADYDMYMSLQITRNTALGWTAVGTGSMMEGSLMFVVYGDPFSSGREGPVVSIRTVDGHHQPRLLSQHDMGPIADLRLLQADWVSATPSRADERKGHMPRNGVKSIAKIALVCYSCGQWPGSQISAESTTQPWIWAWNNNQEIGAYSYDVHLDMHRHHASSGGWGRFYLNMARSISHGRSPPSLPPIRPGVASLGASENFGGGPWNWTDPIVHIHGLLLAIVFLILYPAGVLVIRSSSPKAFRYHRTVQVVTSALFIAGVALGIVKTLRSDSSPLHPHHWIGLTLTVCIFVQSALGWHHHVLFMQIKQRQWASYSHIWLGRGVLLLGWANVIIGLLLAGRGRPLVILAPTLISLDCVVLLGWIYYCSARRRRRQGPQRPLSWGEEDTLRLRFLRKAGNEYSSLALDDGDADDGDSADGLPSSSSNDFEPLLSTGEKELAAAPL